MAVHLIIDGYNLLGVRGQVGMSTPQEGERVRNRLLDELSAYRRRKGHRLTVVFDAWREHGRLEQYEQRDGVEVIFTRAGERADQVIQRLAREWTRHCAVVSSDREVMASAQQSGAFVITSQEFQAKLQSQHPSSSREPLSPDVQGFTPDPFEEERPASRPGKKGNPRKLSKKMRHRNRKLKEF